MVWLFFLSTVSAVSFLIFIAALLSYKNLTQIILQVDSPSEHPEHDVRDHFAVHKRLFRKGTLEPQHYTEEQLDQLEAQFGKNKVIPAEIRAFVLAALSHYPQLADTRIVFQYKPIKQTMNARPLIANLWTRRKQRGYTVIINNNQGPHKGLPLETLSFNIVTGILGHELAHLVAYKEMTNRQMILFALGYLLSDSFHRRVERFTDYTTIAHGMAFPLYDGVEHILQDADLSEEYKNKIHSNYLGLHEIELFWIHANADKLREHLAQDTQINDTLHALRAGTENYTEANTEAEIAEPLAS